jgi:hypothetical protein
VTLAAMFWFRDATYEGTGYSLGRLMLPSVLGMFVALGTLLTIQYLAADREDGTLLRARATPNGIRGYVVGIRDGVADGAGVPGDPARPGLDHRRPPRPRRRCLARTGGRHRARTARHPSPSASSSVR